MSTPIVTVVVPTCNRIAAIQKCVESLVEQTHPAFEVIVVDDGSSDSTADYLASVTETYSSLSFRWFRNDPQAGANAARNRGVAAGRGIYVALLDDDCVAEPTWLERLTAAFEHDRVGAVAGHVVDAQPKGLVDLFFKGSFYVFSPDGVTATRLVGCNMAVRRDVLLRFGLDEDRAAVSADVTVSGRGDETSLFPLISAAGYEQRVAYDAVVVHDHPHTVRSFLRQAYRSGGAHARLSYKYRLRPPTELVPLLLAYLSGPLVWLGRFGWIVPTLFATLFLLGIFYSEISRKQKTIVEAVLVYPLVLIYYHLRLLGSVWQRVRLLWGVDTIDRVDLRRLRRAW